MVVHDNFGLITHGGSCSWNSGLFIARWFMWLTLVHPKLVGWVSVSPRIFGLEVMPISLFQTGLPHYFGFG